MPESDSVRLPAADAPGALDRGADGGGRAEEPVAAALDHLREAASSHDRPNPLAQLLPDGQVSDRDAGAT